MVTRQTKTPDRRNGFYYLEDGKVYPSVTTILDVIGKPQLVPWAAKMGVRAALVDPSISEEDAPYAIYQVKKGAAERGQQVHWFAERYKTGNELKLEDVDPERRGYCEAYMSWYNDYNPEIVAKELKTYSDEHEYAGRLDIVAKLGPNSVCIVDIKTGKAVYDTYALQLEAYKVALKEMGAFDIDKTYVLLLKKEGTYIFEEVKGDLSVFLAAKKLWLWKNGEKYDTRNVKIKKRRK